MKLIIPQLGELNAADARLARLAEFLGCEWEPLSWGRGIAVSPGMLDQRAPEKNSCLVINPEVIRQCASAESFPSDLASFVASRFSSVLVHNLSLDRFTQSTLEALSGGLLGSVRPIERSGLNYEVASDYEGVCGPFSGLTFGPIDTENDRVISEKSGDGPVRTYIRIGRQPFFASVQRERAEVFFLAGKNLLDLQTTMGAERPAKYFSQFVPAAMVLRYLFGDECWRPNQHHATVIIDDPLLRKNYGFLNYDRLLALADKFNFHTSIAFIPHNYRRNSKTVTQMFSARPDRFSICFHGNDHTDAELATTDSNLLNAMLTTAEERMELHQHRTGIVCDKVMVFPQGNFSAEAMNVLKAHNFLAAVNSGPYPYNGTVDISLEQFIQPAVVNYGFALFLREYVNEIKPQDVALNLFFGKPTLIVEHHVVFKHPECLTDLVSRINSFVPSIHWSNLRTALENSYWKRKAPDGTTEFRAYSNAITINNSSGVQLECAVAWPYPPGTTAEKILVDGTPTDAPSNETNIRVDLQIPPRSSRTISVVHPNNFGLSRANRSLAWKAKAFLRRRLSEIRDDYLSRNNAALSTAEFLRRRLANPRS